MHMFSSPRRVKAMDSQAYPAVVIPLSEEDGGGFAAYAPDLYGCMSDGETPQEAIANLQLAILEWCDEMVRLDRPIPAPGTAAERMRDEHEAVLAIIREQDELIRMQSSDLADLQGQLVELRARTRDLVASYHDGGKQTGWFSSRILTVEITRRSARAASALRAS